MHTTVKPEFGTGPVPRRAPHCTPEQARELLEGLRTAYQSLLPTEQIVILGIVAQSAHTQFTQEVNARKRKPSASAVTGTGNVRNRR
jgi:hypothetical protein